MIEGEEKKDSDALTGHNENEQSKMKQNAETKIVDGNWVR